MAKRRTIFRCGDCGGAASQWQGRCPACSAWNTIVEHTGAAPVPAVGGPDHRRAPAVPAVPIGDVDLGAWTVRPTRLAEVDRVLAGGLVPGSVSLLGGEPGIGKSTLLLQLAASMAAAGERVLYVSAEESRQQVRARADRLGALSPRVWLASETSLSNLVGHLDVIGPEIVVVDSIQSVHDPDAASAPGSVTQVRECAQRLVAEAKGRETAVILVGHVTKDGSLAGPRVLEHVVDTVLSFEGERHHALRLLRAVKHRFGSTSELGLFEMTERGLVGVPDPSGLFLGDRRPGIAGSAVVPAMEGHRPLLVELQALVAPSRLAQPRRTAQGLDPGRLALLLAVLDRRAGVPVAAADVFCVAVGGVRVVEPGADLALALAVTSSTTGLALPEDLVACAEIGLGGELRQVHQTARRLSEAARLGFRVALVPTSAPEPPPGVTALRAATIAEAIALAGLGGTVSPHGSVMPDRPPG